jgi:hypothetical protein
VEQPDEKCSGQVFPGIGLCQAHDLSRAAIHGPISAENRSTADPVQVALYSFISFVQSLNALGPVPAC